MNTYEKYTVGSKAVIVILDISTARIGEGQEVEILKIEEEDILVREKNGLVAWVTKYHLDLVK